MLSRRPAAEIIAGQHDAGLGKLRLIEHKFWPTLAFAIVAAKRELASTEFPDKSFYFLGGLTEATETIAAFVAMCLWPQWFAPIAYGFAALCALTTALRIGWGWQRFR
eukprot:gene19284-biopygen12357